MKALQRQQRRMCSFKALYRVHRLISKLKPLQLPFYATEREEIVKNEVKKQSRPWLNQTEALYGLISKSGLSQTKSCRVYFFLSVASTQQHT